MNHGSTEHQVERRWTEAGYRWVCVNCRGRWAPRPDISDDKERIEKAGGCNTKVSHFKGGWDK